MQAAIRVMLPQSKEPQRLPSNHQKPRERPGTDSALVLEGTTRTQPCQQLELRALASRPVREYIYVV